MLEVSNLEVSYGNKIVLKDISFSVSSNEILAVIGPSGVGKTTLIKSIVRLIPFHGKIKLNNHEIDLGSTTISFVPQNYGLLPWKTVEQNIYLASRIKKHSRLNKQQKEKIHELMRELKIDNLSKKFPNFISGGQAQRVALVRSLSISPDLLIFDEAFSALDPVVKKSAEHLFLNQWRKNPTITIMVTHNLDEALKLSTKILVLKSDGTGTLMDNPLINKLADDYSSDKNYFDCLSFLQKEVDNTWEN